MAPLIKISALSSYQSEDDVDILPILKRIFEHLQIAYKNTVIAHPYIFGFILILWSYHPRAPFQAITFIIWTLPKKGFIGILRSVGFGEEGVEAGSYASRYQAAHYQDYIPEDSLFARYQSYGTLGDFTEIHSINRQEEAVPSPWWGLLGWTLYLSGFSVMLIYGSMKGL